MTSKVPYIPEEQRVHGKRGYFARTPGKLNYAITRLCDFYLQDFGVSYQRLNEIIGALECAKLEFARRVVGPYEDSKITENGDVYHLERYMFGSLAPSREEAE